MGVTWASLKPIEESLTRQSHDGQVQLRPTRTRALTHGAGERRAGPHRYQLLHKRADGSIRLYLFYGYNQGENTFPAGSGWDPKTHVPRSDMQVSMRSAQRGHILSRFKAAPRQ